MRTSLFLFLLLYSTITLSQGILVDTTSQSIPELVKNELLQNACANESNFKFSSPQGIGKFTNTNPNFPFQEGIIIRNGIAKHTEGSYTGSRESSQLNTNGDADLQLISNSNGQSTQITDVSFIEFDFTPISNNFSFDFLFASNEYGEFQCGFSDIFAFVLTDISTGIATNLAVIPGTNLPVSVLNIRDDRYNTSCVSSNSTLFGHFNMNNPSTSAINMRGETKILTASSAVIPNRTYRIKLAIGDYNDSNYDSAVFIKGGSFKTTMDLGPDKSICKGEQILIEADLTGNYTYVWTLNGAEIPGATSKSITINQAGNYGATATLSGCVIKDEVTINELILKPPTNITKCYQASPMYQYDLTQNNALSLGLNPAEYSLYFYASLADANSNSLNIPENQLATYSSSGNQTIYIKIAHLSNQNSYCNDLLSFELLLTPALNVIAPADFLLCDTPSGRVVVDLTIQEKQILNNLPYPDYTLSYFNSETNANNNENPIPNPETYTTSLGQTPQVIWIRIQNKLLGCFTVVALNLIINPLPLADTLPDVIVCDSYTLPPIINGKYFTGPDGTGTQLNIGDTITLAGTYYIYSPPTTTTPCSNQTTFRVFFVNQFIFPTEACDRYIVPSVLIGGFFTAPAGAGTLIASGTALTINQTIYYYAKINGVVCRDEAIPLNIFPLPPIDQLPDVITCNSFTLPILANGNYYT
ncbi:MAG: choice-of-anchor L domain-containing protein, partial [Flavobacterium sp.]